MIDIFLNIFGVIALICFYYAWNRNGNPYYKWMFWILVTVNLVVLWRIAIRPHFHLGPTISVLQYLAWKVILVADLVLMIAASFVFREKKTTFLINQEGYSEYSYFDDKGFPIIGTFNTHFPQFPNKSKLPFFRVVYCQFKADSLGLPKNSDEVRYWDIFETDFEKDMKSVCDIYFVARVTYRGLRRIVYYVSDDKKFEDEVAQWRRNRDLWWNKSKGEREFYTSFAPDEQWEHAKALHVGTVFCPPIYPKEANRNSFAWWNRRWWEWK